jgi:hypothetical protein
VIPKNALRAVLRYGEASRELNRLEVARLSGRPVEANRLKRAEDGLIETREAAVVEIAGAEMQIEVAAMLTAIAAKGGT